MRLKPWVLLLPLAAALGQQPALAAEPPVLTLGQKIPLGHVIGRIDHMAIDLKRQHLFVAERGNNSVGVVDLAKGAVIKTITGLREPQGVGFSPEADRLFVANAEDGSVRFYSGADFVPTGQVALSDDADNIRIDGEGHVLVGYGNGGIAVLDPQSGKKIGDISLAVHPEAFTVDAKRNVVYVNEPSAQRIAVLDLPGRKERTRWVFPRARSNFPMALDAEHGRLFVAYRDRPTLAAFDVETGKVQGTTPTCGDADDLFYDAKRARLYISCGDGFLAVIDDAYGQLHEITKIPTKSGARTALFVPELDELFLAVRAATLAEAEIWVYHIQ